jgi:hypothetical protein
MKGMEMLRWPWQVMIHQEQEQDVVDCDSFSAMFLKDAAHLDIFMGLTGIEPRRP